jgi:HIRAN domain
VQSSPLAGSQYYAVGAQWQQMQVGDRLELIREPDNRHDKHAIRVEWRGHKLGYVPRAENRAVAAALDGGDKLVARIARLSEHPDPWQRVRFEVFVEL